LKGYSLRLPPDSPLHEDLGHRRWTKETPVERKLHGSLEDLRRTTSFVRDADVSDKKKKIRLATHPRVLVNVDCSEKKSKKKMSCLIGREARKDRGMGNKIGQLD
jgi:hypothetical protein